jgi:hypothetical protein
MPSAICSFVALMVAALACGGPARSSVDANSPPGRLARAIEAGGGREALEQAKAILWDGDAVVRAGGKTVNITGHWAIQPPDTANVATYDVTRGPTTMRSLIVAAPRGWTVSQGQYTPLPASVLASERDEFYLYDVMRLVSLEHTGVALVETPPDSLGHPGFRAIQNGRPDVDLYVDAEGRLAHISVLVANPGGGAPMRQDAWLEGSLESGGVRWPRTLRLTMAGQPYFDLTMRALRVLPRLQDAVFAGPREK